MGTPEFAVPSLQVLLDSPHQVVGVFTQPDRPKGRGHQVVMSPVKELALSRGIPVYQPLKIGRDGLEQLAALAPDLCVTAAFGQILSQKVLDVPTRGTVNVHASLLPRHRGSAPIAWAILQGDGVTGVTTMMTDRGIDTGDMLLRAETEIQPGETCGELTQRLSVLGASLLMDTLAKLEAGEISPIPQCEADMTYDPMLNKSMSPLSFEEAALDVVNRVHGLNPWPCATAVYQGVTLKILRAAVAQGEGAPGKVLRASPREGLVVAAREGAVAILSLQAPGKKPMSAADYLRGNPMEAGTSFDDAPPGV